MTTPWTPEPDSSRTDPAAPGTADHGAHAYPPPTAAAPANGGYPQAGQGFPPPAGQGFPPPAGQAYPPPAGQPVGPPDATYPPGMIPPPAAPANNRKRQWVMVAAVLVIFAVIATVLIVRNQKTSTTAANVGDCIKVTSTSLVDPKTEQAPCSDPTALYKVTETGGSDVKCDPNEPSYVEGKDTDHPSSQVCLRYNLAVGDCVDEGATSSSVPKRVDCSTATSTTAKLLAIDVTSADESKCPADSTPLPLVKRNIVYCFGDAS